MSLKNKKGMTLIEILVVVSIIAFLFVVVGQAVNQRRKKAQISQAKIVINIVDQAIIEFSYDCGFYPSSLEDLVEPIEDCEAWGPDSYLKNGRIPKDPWNNRLVYDYDEEANDYAIISQGADRRPGGEGFNKDISSKD